VLFNSVIKILLIIDQLIEFGFADDVFISAFPNREVLKVNMNKRLKKPMFLDAQLY